MRTTYDGLLIMSKSDGFSGWISVSQANLLGLTCGNALTKNLGRLKINLFAYSHDR